MYPYLPLTLALAMLAATALAQDFAAGRDAAGRGDFATALENWKPLAEGGDAASQYNLAMMYARGEGVEKDLATAGRWFLAAAEQGNVEAQARIGAMYARGLGVEQDYQKAARWLHDAAQRHHAHAQYELGVLFANGQGVPRDESNAYFWFTLAGLQHQHNAMNAQIDLRERLAPAQVQMVEQQVRDWLEKRIGAKFEPPPGAADGAGHRH